MAKNKKVVNASDEAIELAKEQGIDIDTVKGSGTNGTVTVPDVEKAIKAKDKAGDDNKGSGKGKGFYYIVNKPAYRSEKELVQKGVYKSKVRIERFDKMSDGAVQCFEGAINDSVVIETAKNLGIVTEVDGKMVEPETLLEKINPQEL